MTVLDLSGRCIGPHGGLMGGVARPTPSRGASPLVTKDTDHAGSVSEVLPFAPSRGGSPPTRCRVKRVGGGRVTGGSAAWVNPPLYPRGGAPLGP